MKRRILRHICCGAVAIMLMMPSLSAAASIEPSGTIRLPFRDLSAEQITKEMGLGWNLGNTMDAHSGFMPSETAWQSVVTSSELIKAVHDAGFNTVRIPVTWGLKIDDDDNYTIDPLWMNRVLEIAEYCLAQDMYVIINIHHDGAEQSGWLRVAAQGAELETVKEKFARVWEQIALAFCEYDEHVIFESMNEVKSDDDSRDGILRDFQVINELNQIFVNTVRKTGGNNTRRWLLVPGRYTNIVNTTNETNGFALPNDPWNEQNRLMVSVHDYDYMFGLLETMGVTSWSEESAAKMARNFQRLIDLFTSKDIPVVLGEYGAVNKNNTEARAYYYEVMARLSRLSGVVCCAWDIGWYDMDKNPDYTMTLFDRESGEIIFPQIVRAILRGHFGADETAGLNNIKSIIRGTKDKPVEIIPVSSLSLSTHTLSLSVGSFVNVTAQTLPADTNEAVLYATSDPSVATVYDGLIRAKGIGRCTVFVYAQSDGVREQIEVTVYPDNTLVSPIESIVTGADQYTVPVSASRQIDVFLPEGTDDVISFASSDPGIVTVGKLGTLTGKSIGSAYVVITTRSGLVKTVSVDVVPEISLEDALEAAIYAYYNDADNSFFNNCMGETMIIPGNGTYTLTFDTAKHLSDDAKKAGVKSLLGVGAIYLADIKGQNGLLASCDIFYEEIVLDGQKLTITQAEPKTALKTGKRFDTNDPINAWDGSSVAEASAKNFVITFEGFDEPKSITVTFTISNFVHSKDVELEVQETIPAAISLASDNVAMDSASAVSFAATLSPKNTTESACFVSGNPGVVWVSPLAIAPDKNGAVIADLIPIGSGETTVGVRTPNGQMQEFSVAVTMIRPALDGTMDVYIEPSTYIMEEPTEQVLSEDAQEPESSPVPEDQKQSTEPDAVVFALLGAFCGAIVLCGVLLAAKVIKRKKRD